MTLYLDDKIKLLLPKQNTFDYVMSLRGKVFRELENRRTQYIEVDGKGYFLKQHFGIGWKEIFKNLLQGRLPVLGATNEWRAVKKLESLNISTLRILAYGKRKYNPAAQESFLLSEELINLISLEEYCRNWQKQKPSFTHKQKLISELARVTATLHNNGINHRDCYLCHFLFDTAKHDLTVIDLHRAQIRKRIPARWRIKDLAGLYYSSMDIGLTSRDIIRFVQHYTQLPRRQVLQELTKTFWQKVKERGVKLYNKR